MANFDVNKYIEFFNQEIIIKINNQKLILDDTLIHIILFILFDFDNINEDLDLIFNEFEKDILLKLII